MIKSEQIAEMAARIVEHDVSVCPCCDRQWDVPNSLKWGILLDLLNLAAGNYDGDGQ